MDRNAWITRGLRLEVLSIVWMAAEAALALIAAAQAHSLTLLAFGADSAIELASASVLFWRLDCELRRGNEFSERTERIASKVAGGLLFALAAYVVTAAAWSVFRGSGGEFSLLGTLVAITAIPLMYWLSRAKLTVASAIGSQALKADAAEAVTCAWLSFVVTVGLAARLVFKAWWLDGVTSLAIVYFLIREGREAWEGEDCGACEA